MVSAKVVLPKSCWFNSWTSINLYGWKFKSWCKIRLTVVSDNLRALRMAYCRSTWALLNSILHGLNVFRSSDLCADPPCFFFVKEAVVRKLCIQKSIIFCDGILPWRTTLKCRRNFPCDGYRFAVFNKRLHDECTVLRAPLLNGNWNCKTLSFQCYPSHGNCTLHPHILAVQKTSGFTGGPCIIFFKIFEKVVSKEMSLKFEVFVLSPFLNKGWISENFNLEGNVPVEIILLQI